MLRCVISDSNGVEIKIQNDIGCGAIRETLLPYSTLGCMDDCKAIFFLPSGRNSALAFELL